MSDRPSGRDFEKDLWSAAREEQPSTAARERALTAALAAGVAGPGGQGGGGRAPSGAPDGTTATKGVALGWKVAAALLATGGAAAIYVDTRPPEPVVVASAAPLASTASRASTASSPSAAKVADPAPSGEPSAAPIGPVASSASSAAPSSVHAAASAATRAPTLDDEILAIDRARALLKGGDGFAALRALDAYDRSFPHGKLAPEAAVLRHRALATVGPK